MSNETEKLTINLGVVELAQIDVLVEQGIYSNRSDLIRTAIRKQLEIHKEKVERLVIPNADVRGIGITSLSKEGLKGLFEANGERPIKIDVIGMLRIADDISTELFTKTVSRVSIRGKLVAPAEIKMLIEGMK